MGFQPQTCIFICRCGLVQLGQYENVIEFLYRDLNAMRPFLLFQQLLSTICTNVRNFGDDVASNKAENPYKGIKLMAYSDVDLYILDYCGSSLEHSLVDANRHHQMDISSRVFLPYSTTWKLHGSITR